MQRDPALEIPLPTTHLGATETPLALDPDPLRPGLERRCYGALHGATERDSILDLIRHTPSQEGGVEIGVLDLVDVQFDGASGHCLEIAAETLRLRALASDHHTGAGGVDVDDEPITGALYVDPRNGSPGELVLQVVPDLPVFVDEVDVLLVGEPLRLPVCGYPESERIGVDFLTHQFTSSFVSETTIVIWLVRLRILVARPRARGR